MFTYPGDTALEFGAIKIYWYGICMAFAILMGIFTSVKISRKFYPRVEIDTFYDLMFYVLLGGIAGARLYYTVFNWDYFSNHLFDIPKLWMGGLSIHGAILGGFLVGLIYLKVKKKNFWMYADVTTFGLCVGQIFGRLGNFFNSEAFGAPTELPWKLFIPLINRPEGYEHFVFFHPTFLYEMIWNTFVVTILYLAVKNHPQRPYGQIFFTYLILYSVGRILIEKLRLDSVFNFHGYPIAMWASAVLIILGILGFNLTQKNKKGD